MAERPPAGSVALIGPRRAGKTTLFCHLTGADYARAAPQSLAAPLCGRVPVPDERLELLHRTAGPGKRMVPATIELFDMPALDPEDPRRNASLLGQLRVVDGFLAVLPAHESRGRARQEAERHRAAILSMLLLADLDVMHRRIESLQRTLRRASAEERAAAEYERATLERLAEEIAAGRTQAVRDLSPQDERRLRGFSFFSRKPIVWLTNAAEQDLPLEELGTSLALEAEIAQLPQEERREFLELYGLAEPVVPRLPRLLLEALDCILFFTIGTQEVAAWPLARGATALEAAGRIHTAMQTGFISAEVIPFEAWRAHHEAKSPPPRPRLEGRGYLVEDGDILLFRFGR